MTKLALKGVIATRYTVECLAEEYPGVTDIDFSGVTFVGFTAMAQILVSFPGAAFTGMEGYTRTQYESVLTVTGEDSGRHRDA